MCMHVPDLQCSVVQVVEDCAQVLPPESLKIESIKDMTEFKNYEILPFPDADAQWQKGQYIAKAWSLEANEWTFYAARLNVLTKAGPYAKFEADGTEQLQKDLSRDNYGKLWVFLKKTDQVLQAEQAALAEKEEAKRARAEKKREREQAAAALRASRPKREGTARTMRELRRHVALETPDEGKLPGENIE